MMREYPALRRLATEPTAEGREAARALDLIDLAARTGWSLERADEHLMDHELTELLEAGHATQY